MDKTICHYLLDSNKRDSSLAAVKFKRQKNWHSISWQNLYIDIENTAASLTSLGVKKGDPVVILSNTRQEWLVADMAILSLGAVTVPIYQSSRPEEVEYILNDCQPTAIILENALQVKKWQKLENIPSSISKIICIESYSELPDEILSWEEFIDEGTDLLAQTKSLLVNCINERTTEDVASILYTSGTTGNPKGVVLTHLQIVSEVTEAFDLFDIGTKDTSLTFLPYAHVLGRVEAWGSIYTGYTLAFAESIERIRQNLIEIKPTIMIAVPRIFEKLYVAIVTQVEANPIKHKLFHWAMKIGQQVSRAQVNKDPIPIYVLLQYRLAKKLVFDTFSEKMGGRLRFAISGGAPLEKKIAEFFHAAGLLLLEGYGLTETTGAICVNSPLNYKFGTVGKPIGDVNIKIADDGEILVKSNKVMKEYFNNNDETEKVFSDGYFATGDIGNFTNDGYLKITDRKKDLIKTAGGKYVAPQKLENLLKLNRFISNILIHGDKKKYIVALVTLDEVETVAYAKTKGLSYQSFSSLTQHSQIISEIRKGISEVNSGLSSYETIKNFAVLTKDFTIEDGELTPSLKVKRKFCDEKYKEKIDSLYG